MTTTHSRWGRTRDLLLLLLSMLGVFLGCVLVAGRIWFHSLFFVAFGTYTLLLGVAFWVLAIVAGAAYALTPPPCHIRGDERITKSDEG